MPKRVQLPPELQTRVFTVRLGRDYGLGEGRLRGTDLEKPFHGIRVPRRLLGPTPDSVVARCNAYLPLLRPGQAFSHATAALLWRVPLPLALESGAELHLSAQPGSRAPSRRGVVGHQLTTSVEIRMRGRMPVLDPAVVFCQLASVLSLHDLVAAGDHLILKPVYGDARDPRPYLDFERLKDVVVRFRGRGKKNAIAALDLMRHGAESRPESLLRLLLQEAGLPEPLVNPVILDRYGNEIGRADLVYERWRVIVEYDGEQHRTDDRQYDRDEYRKEQFARAGWTVIQVRKRALFGARAATVARVESALRDAGWRP